MQCPKCQIEMQPLEMMAVNMDLCPLCNGCWLDRRELETFTRSRGADSLRVDTLQEKHETRFRCPRCQNPMVEGRFSRLPELVLDQCPQCRGLWLDRGELSRLLSFRG
ncbi:MAG TPA: zf-TFIIB domain-containing protein [Candidatus Nitrosotenuis sp.]|jgi:Zn-finger nucleic acid-binding protein|nr:zf-TFIIB domain-containing protein [Candidatus Nitrosotenuis sp.]